MGGYGAIAVVVSALDKGAKCFILVTSMHLNDTPLATALQYCACARTDVNL